MNSKHNVIVITGAAGTGKTSVSDYLKKEYGIPSVVTHTTRKPRDKEKNGIDYYFENPESFSKLHFLEHVNYSGKQYGSSYEGLDRAFCKNNVVSIVLDTAGAISYLNELGPEAEIIFMKVNHTSELEERMLKRGDSVASVEKRMASKEDRRDLTLPAELKGHVDVIDNEDWLQTERKVDDIVKDLKK